MGSPFMDIDKSLSCCDCGITFSFSASEQEFFKQKGLLNIPKRCPSCRLLLRMQRQGISAQHTAEVHCSECGQSTRVPFQPKGYKPVYCSRCFHIRKQEQAQEQEKGQANEQIEAPQTMSDLEQD